MRDLPGVESRSRRCTVDDLPWVLSLAHRRYTKTPDPGTTLAWLVRVLNHPDALALRSDGAFCAAVIQTQPWWPDEPECHVVVLVADKGCHWQAVRLLEDSILWAQNEKNCVRWYLNSDTDYDFEPLAKWVKADFVVKKYGLILREV